MGQLKKYDVFVSYSHDDERVAKQICALLDEYRITYFLDKESIKPASDWLDVLAESIKSCKIFLLLVSKHSFESEYSMMELQYAYSERNNCDISILPYLIDDGITKDTMPGSMKMMLNSIQWISVNDVPIGKPLIQDIKSLLRGHFIEKTDLSALPKVMDMHCYLHPNRSVAGYCADCGKFLCSECASKYSPCLCDDCYNTRLSNNKSARRKLFFRRLIIGAIIALLAWGFSRESLGDEAYIISGVLFFLPYGGSILSTDSIIGFAITLPFALIGGVFIFVRDLIRLPINKFY